jgi:poly(3-hydroxybutyrate) depolymerase
MFVSDKTIQAIPLPTYHMFEMARAMMQPARMMAEATTFALSNPFNPFRETPMARQMLAGAEMTERYTRRYAKPAFNLPFTTIDGKEVAITEVVSWQKPFCKLLHFKRSGKHKDPKVLIVAPMSGHYATLLRTTVETFLPAHEVYITDWQDARMIPASEGKFDLDDYTDYVQEMIRHVGKGVNVIAVCQPSVPVLSAVSLMEAANEPVVPSTLTLMGGPIDTRLNPTAVNKLADDKGLDWFRTKVITRVPFPHLGFSREVYPGFLQLTGFMTMNMDKHVDAHKDLYKNLMRGNDEDSERTRDFYDEYMAVMDLTAEFYLQTIDKVFIRHCLPEGTMMVRDQHVDPSKITRVALATIEGEKDDITGGGQTEAAHTLCTNIPDNRRLHYTQDGVGHYGVFSGSKFRAQIAPKLMKFMRDMA